MPKSRTTQAEFNKEAVKQGYGMEYVDTWIPEGFRDNMEDIRDIYKKKRSDKDPLPDEIDRRLEKRDPEALKILKRVTSTKPKKESSIVKKAKGGSVKFKGDGIAQRGKTKGRMI